MKKENFLGHLFAISGLTLLTGLGTALALQESEPIPVPQQTVMHVAMIAEAPPPPPPPPEVQPQAEIIEPVPPKPIVQERGMIKEKKPEKKQVQQKKPAPKPVQKQVAKPVEKKNISEKPSSLVQNNLPPAEKTVRSSGVQSPQGTQKTSAITKPIAANYLNNPPPEYPSKAKRRGWEGTVHIRAIISPQGTVQSAQIIRSAGYSILDSSALKSVRKWRFIPAKQGGQAIQADVVVPIKFRLTEG